MHVGVVSVTLRLWFSRLWWLQGWKWRSDGTLQISRSSRQRRSNSAGPAVGRETFCRYKLKKWPPPPPLPPSPQSRKKRKKDLKGKNDRLAQFQGKQVWREILQLLTMEMSWLERSFNQFTQPQTGRSRLYQIWKSNLASQDWLFIVFQLCKLHNDLDNFQNFSRSFCKLSLIFQM